jgi:hypothetical protein
MVYIPRIPGFSNSPRITDFVITIPVTTDRLKDFFQFNIPRLNNRIDMKQEIIEWGNENLKGNFSIDGDFHIYFDSEIDLIHFKMRWF